MSEPAREDGALRALFQGLPRERAAGEACPPAEELWAAARGELPPGRNREVIDHTGRCPSCAEDWRLARHVARKAPAGAAPSARPAAAAWRPVRRLAMAAGLLLAVALGGVWLLESRFGDRDRVLRAGPGQAIESLVPEDRPLSRREPVLRWRGPEGATYRLSVVTAEPLRVLVREERLRATEYSLPTEVVASLPAGSMLDWQVTARLADGTELPSRTFRVRLAARPDSP